MGTITFKIVAKTQLLCCSLTYRHRHRNHRIHPALPVWEELSSTKDVISSCSIVANNGLRWCAEVAGNSAHGQATVPGSVCISKAGEVRRVYA